MPDITRLSPLKGYAALRKGRHSSSGCDCFLTICLRRPTQAFLDADMRERCLAEMRLLECENTWTVRCAVIMPDHLHLLVTLGVDADLSAAVRLLKGRLAPALRRLGAAWQPSFFDRRLRPDDELLPFFSTSFSIPIGRNLSPWIKRGLAIIARNRTGFGSAR
jgi:putative transposase